MTCIIHAYHDAATSVQLQTHQTSSTESNGSPWYFCSFLFAWTVTSPRVVLQTGWPKGQILLWVLKARTWFLPGLMLAPPPNCVLTWTSLQYPNLFISGP